jgi:antirestriction protein
LNPRAAASAQPEEQQTQLRKGRQMTDQTNNPTPINVELREDRCGFRLSCTVCGGTTEKFEALAEAEVEGTTIRVCRGCLKAGQIDERLRGTVAEFENYSAFLRSLIGRLQVPSYEEWQAHDEKLDVEDMCEFDGIDKAEALRRVRAQRDGASAAMAAARVAEHVPFEDPPFSFGDTESA